MRLSMLILMYLLSFSEAGQNETWKYLGQKLPGQVMKSGPREPERAEKVCGTH